MRKAGPAIASIPATGFLADPTMQDEVFGPFTMLIRCQTPDEMKSIARSIHGQLTSTLHCTDKELTEAKDLIAILREKAGRLIFNGVPTGVEVCNAMVHGGPYPSTTDSRFTAVGHSAIRRWARPVAYQNCPQALLPEALQDGNPLGIWRTIDGIIAKH
jgi:NADP-dependent aldehyde dehydrogenase